MTRRWIVVATTLGALAGGLHGGALAAQRGPCAASPAELARVVTTARAPGLTPAEQPLFAAAVSALRAGSAGEAGRKLGALVRANPGLSLCALVHAAVRQGTLERDPRMLARLRAPARPPAASAGTGDTAQLTRYQLQSATQDYQQAVSTIAAIQKRVYDDAMKIIGNLRS